MVPTPARANEKYIEGLPPQIQDTVLGSKPETLDEAITLAATLTENHVKKGTMFRKGTKKPVESDTSESGAKGSPPPTNKRKNYVVVTPAP